MFRQTELGRLFPIAPAPLPCAPACASPEGKIPCAFPVQTYPNIKTGSMSDISPLLAPDTTADTKALFGFDAGFDVPRFSRPDEHNPIISGTL